MAPKRNDDDENEDAKLSHNPFGALASLRDQLPEGKPAKAPRRPKTPARAVVRLERKGHGGKEVTIVSHLELTPKSLEEWLKALKSDLGCGGVVDEDMIYLQGDQRDRVEKWLEKRGVGKVTVS